MVIKRKLRNSTANTSTPVPEVKSEEIKTPSPTPPVKVERRGRPRKSETSEEITNDRPVKASRPNETFKIIPFNPKGTTSNSKGKEKETTQSPTDLPSEPVYNEPVQQFEPNFVTLPEAPVFSPLPQQQSHITPPIQGASTYSDQVPLYAIRYISKPIQICFPKEALFNSSFANKIHLNNFNQLTAQVIIFHKNELWDEANILERLYYKNKNQHQRAGYFRKIIEVRKFLKRIKEMGINELMSGFIEAFYSKKIGKIRSTWDQVPSQEMVIFVMNRLIGVVLLMNKALQIFNDAFNTFSALLRQTEFMSFALACLAILARFNILTRVMLEEIKKCYGLLRNWVEYFPRSSQTIPETDLDNEINKLPEFL
ncbi:hypothetical protein RhiirA5_396227 [Rhizophagus irregularis]|uniref:Nucleolus and neural progenitor protein-like N-terminal domain-containing protein n=2 Tax=Rhizophagus irregularis TaxID=588596 RepID=A0A2N0Q341_9GLOM|nr:hypothetical protein GLOIN_2v1607904 [Rhizophagus irregularis DAOM 181602=DAOM 197198]PKC13479.1 hypothetical protein RhiirA5_396227 [Rhizophagus irregularis]POG71230.1 hypothetical protein GLOIN_2v1607904 [Rhizophagus irregularis DAOM 181602=DAOM 197198]|eukprot:XP_025178096.1 hypothetical protein GLOIN_2v1607904 [Rhizophagus irregularis DAOM 181602=DAOM 197198]